MLETYEVILKIYIENLVKICTKIETFIRKLQKLVSLYFIFILYL